MQQIDVTQGCDTLMREHADRQFSFQSLMRRYWYLLAVPLVLIPLIQIVAILWLIWERTQDVPNADEWSIILIVIRFHWGQLNPADFWEPNNGHRIVVMRIIDLFLIELTHYNRQVMMTVNVAVATGTALLFLACVRRTFSSMRAVFLLLAPLSLLLFSLGQFEDWMLVFTNNFFTLVFAVALCMWALATGPPSWRRILVALFAALLASLSSFPGLALWAVFLPVLWILGYRRMSYLIPWIVAALLITAAYLVNLPKVTAATGTTPLGTLHYVLAYLGAPLSTGASRGHIDLARAQIAAVAGIGFMIVHVFIFWWMHRDLRPIAVWLGLAIFAFACACMAAIGRGAELGVSQALQSRYQMFSALWWVALIVIAALTTTRLIERRWDGQDRWPRRLSSAAVGLTAVGAVVVCGALVQANLVGFREGRIYLNLPREEQYCILNYDAAPGRCLQSYFPFPDGIPVARYYASQLERLQLGVFYHHHALRLSNLTRTSQPTLYSVDSVGGVPTGYSCQNASGCGTLPDFPPIVVPSGTPLEVRGWAVDANAKEPAGGVLVSIDGTADAVAEYGGAYPGVAQNLRNPAYNNIAFTALAPTDTLPIGIHSLTIRIVTHDGTAYYELPQKIAVDIRPLQDFAVRSSATPYGVEGVGAVERLVTDFTKPVVFSRHNTITVTGWAVDGAVGMPAREVYLSIDGTTNIAADYGGDRAFVVTGLGNQSYLHSGFLATIPIDTLAVGKHELSLKILAADGVSYYQPPWRLEIVIEE